MKRLAFPIPVDALAHHIATLGKTGSGKTSTEKVIVEHVVAEGFRVCVLDPIKSDWWGITSSGDGKKPGLPFKILGGPRGHVPLHSSAGAAVGQLVGSGKLPLSIIDMADFEPGGLQRFFTEFAPALMRSARGVLYLVIEEAHEFAPKERAGLGAENLAIHWAKKLATAGRSKGIRLIVATQRVQALHNAVLGSCETVIAHRLTTPADQEPVIKWLKANTDKETTEAVAGSLSSLPTGTAWVCSGEERFFEKVGFPKFRTYDNTATPTSDADEIKVATAPVDHDELRAILGEAADEAKANDPKALKVEVARLSRELAAEQRKKQPPALIPTLAPPDREALKESFEEGRQEGIVDGLAMARDALAKLKPDGIEAKGVPSRARTPVSPPPPVQNQAPAIRIDAPTMQAPTANGMTVPQQRVIDAIAWWIEFGVSQPSTEQAAFVAGYSSNSSGYNNLRGQLRTLGFIDYPAPGKMALTAEGGALANAPAGPFDLETFHLNVRMKLAGPQLRLLNPLIRAYPDSMSTGELAEAAGYSVTSSGFNNLRGKMRTLGFIEYPSSGMARAADWLFPRGRA